MIYIINYIQDQMYKLILSFIVQHFLKLKSVIKIYLKIMFGRLYKVAGKKLLLVKLQKF